jgi:uncharacterized RDD family membrane protein YckC
MMGIENNGIAASVSGVQGRSATSGVGETELIYVGFWRRLAAYVIDFLLLVPYGLFATWFAYMSKYAFAFNQLVGMVIAVVFDVYLVKRFGGSPGKLIMEIRIAKVDGRPVGYKEASIRYSILFVISLLTSVALAGSALNMSNFDYAALTSKTRARHIRELAPAWYQPVEIAGSVWVWSEFLVLLTNRKRRALHDFMAGTVVVRTDAAHQVRPS